MTLLRLCLGREQAPVTPRDSYVIMSVPGLRRDLPAPSEELEWVPEKQAHASPGAVDEPFLVRRADRYVLFPIQHRDIWEMYKTHEACFWTAEEIDLSRDKDDWKKLTENERWFIEHVLAFFAASDSIVLENLGVNFIDEIPVAEARCFYGFQMMMENVHSETYSLLIDTYIEDTAHKTHLLNAIETVPCVGGKANWAIKWMNREQPLATRLLAFAAVEGIFFSGSFCAIFWLRKRGLMHGLCYSNELISRDEGLHTNFACLLFRKLLARPTTAQAHDIIGEALASEKNFICEALPCALIGMNSDLMSQYLEFVADHLLVDLGYPRLFFATNPFEWMELISLTGKTNFFERRVGDYQKSGVKAAASSVLQHSFSVDCEF